mmetsp:Transcript_5658/g.7919  ORF Transcript_5658/g.7919 Transcript_5658/m.7919 type:complete len:194 (+) Transcript_5658:78-659(+)
MAETENPQDEEQLLKKVEEITGKQFDFIPYGFTFTTEDVDFKQLKVGDHLWIESEEKHIIILDTLPQNVLSALVLDKSGIQIEKVKQMSSIKRFNYVQGYSLDEDTSRRMLVLAVLSLDPSISGWEATQYAFLCTTGGFMLTERFQYILKNPGQTYQDNLHPSQKYLIGFAESAGEVLIDLVGNLLTRNKPES